MRLKLKEKVIYKIPSYEQNPDPADIYLNGRTVTIIQIGTIGGDSWCFVKDYKGNYYHAWLPWCKPKKNRKEKK